METCLDGALWRVRRDDGRQLAESASRQRMIAIGAEYARWTGVRHVIRAADGSVAEIATYESGPYPTRSPVHREQAPGAPV